MVMMSYRFVLNNSLVNEIDDLIWFSNSYGSIPDWEYREVNDVDRDYEKIFNLKLIYDEDNEVSKNIQPIVAVEFPSEEEAVMFMLKWA